MKQIQNILFLARWYPNRYDPMPGLFIRRHAEALSFKRNVAVIYPHAVYKSGAPLFELNVTGKNQLTEIVIYYRSFHSGFGKVYNIAAFFLAIGKGFRTLQKQGFKPDFVHVHVLTRLAFVAFFLNITRQIPYGITEHWSRYLPLRNEFNGWLRRKTTRMLVKKSAFVTTVTENLAEAMKNHDLKNDHYLILPNVVDIQLFRPIEKIEKSVFTFIHISCFEDQSKNISGLLRVISRLSLQRSDFRVIMVGEGMDLPLIHELAIQLNLHQPILTFKGLLQDQELANSLQQSDSLILFSNYENLPVVIPESFACGLPVIATKVGGIPEIVHPSNGILVNPGDENALLLAMSEMIDNYQRYHQSDIRAQVVKHNSTEAVGNFLANLYDQFIPEDGK